MMGREVQCMCRVFGFLVVAVTCRAEHVPRTVMLYNNGSINNFDTLWNTAGAINDPHGNKSLLSVTELLDTDNADFKAYIDQSFGNIIELELIGYNALGDELFFVLFDVEGLNISQVNNWFSNLNPFSINTGNPKAVSTVARDGNKELLILLSSTKTLFSILHPATGPGLDSHIVLAVNSSAALTVNSTVDNVVDEGCWANWELSLNLSFTDDNSLTVQACVMSCTTPYVAIQLGKNCFCGDFLSNHSPVSAMCAVPCPGDGAYTCGGISDGYYSVYSATYTQSELDTLSAEPESVPLMVFSHTSGYIYTKNVTSELFSQGWADEYIYIDRIRVNATNATGHVMLFSFEYSDDIGLTYREYDDNGKHYFDTDGIPVELHILYVTSIRISYEWDVVQSTIELFGPTTSSYVSVPLIAVIALLDETQTTTAPGNTAYTGSTTDPVTATVTNNATISELAITTNTTVSGTTSAPASTTTSGPGTTSAPGSTASSGPGTTSTSGSPSTSTSYLSAITSLYVVYPNMSVSISGTLYCPCNQTVNASTSQNLTSIYQDSNKTFEELMADLTLDADTLSSNKRKYNSARDMRASASTLGALGLIVIITSVSFIVYLDSARLVQEAIKIKKTYRVLKKRISKRSLRVDSIDVQCLDNPDIPNILK